MGIPAPTAGQLFEDIRQLFRKLEQGDLYFSTPYHKYTAGLFHEPVPLFTLNPKENLPMRNASHTKKGPGRRPACQGIQNKRELRRLERVIAASRDIGEYGTNKPTTYFDGLRVIPGDKLQMREGRVRLVNQMGYAISHHGWRSSVSVSFDC